MRKPLLTLLSLIMCTSLFPQETRGAGRPRYGQAAGYSSRDATTLSMMGWGVGIFAGIAAICAIIPNDASTSH